MKASPSGAWLDLGGHMFDASLAAAIVQVMKDCNVRDMIDIGCGDGSYTRYVGDSGLICIGYDGNPVTPKVTDGLCQVADFSQAQYLGRYDAVLCLEVGEHIPSEYEAVFIDNLCRHSGTVIVLSWAIPGQTGFGHVNERSNEYIIDRMAEHGWIHDPLRSNVLRNAASNCYWFDDTVMVFAHGH